MGKIVFHKLTFNWEVIINGIGEAHLLCQVVIVALIDAKKRLLDATVLQICQNKLVDRLHMIRVH